MGRSRARIAGPGAARGRVLAPPPKKGLAGRSVLLARKKKFCLLHVAKKRVSALQKTTGVEILYWKSLARRL